MTDNVPDYTINSYSIPKPENSGKEYYYYFTDAKENLGYYMNIPAVFASFNALGTWATGRGITTSRINVPILEKIMGNGSESFQKIMFNHLIIKLIVGDSFCEIIRNDKGTLINLIPISPERVRIVYEDNRIKRYDVYNDKEGWRPIKKQSMLHSINKKIGDSIRGTSQLNAVKSIVKAWHEALEDTRVIQHRSKALGIAYYKTDNTGKISYLNSQIEKAVKNGEMLGVPEEQVEIKDFPTKATGDRIAYIQYLENLFFACSGVPRSIATSDGVSEVGGKMGHIIFEVTYGKEAQDLEDDLWLQVGIRVKFNKPPSLGGLVSEEEQKNSNQTKYQANDAGVGLQRE